jgi:hypothetical protein
MKESILLNAGWSLKRIEPAEKIDAGAVSVEGEWLDIGDFPAQIHEALLRHGLIPEEYLVGWCEKTLWTYDFDWLYRCVFPAVPGKRGRLDFLGLDTVADIYLNGRKIGSHDDFYCRSSFDAADLKDTNTLLVHFHNVKDILARMELNPEWQGLVMKCKLLRKPVHDFPPEEVQGSEYQGASPWVSLLGIYRDVFLVYPDETGAELSDETTELRAFLKEDGTGEIFFRFSGGECGGGMELTVKAAAGSIGENGTEYSASALCEAGASGYTAGVSLTINAALPWWPRGMGPQNLYMVRAELRRDGKLIDRLEKKIGFRKIETPSPFEFIVNGKHIRLFGGTMDPLQGYTHCWQPDRARRMFTMVENANMNVLRIWAEGEPLPDAFYEEADRRGILIWQDFFMGWGNYPDTEEYSAKCVSEVRELVLRLRHHASVLMWCGGNETMMGAVHEYKKVINKKLLYETFPALLEKLDPNRYYHPSSPSGGAWVNDPREGDYHTYNRVIEYPYGDYPNFTSECIRTAPPVLHSLRRIVKGELWPEAYDGKFRYEDTFPFPENWAARTHHEAKGHIKTGPYWEFYDADTPDQLIYRFAAAYAKDLRKELERIRMGSPDGNVPQSKRSKGYCCCKLLDTWPKIYCAVIDFFQEGFIPYYATKRGMQPLLLCFDRKDSIRLWFCNDSASDFHGSVELGLYNFSSEKFIAKETFKLSMPQCESGIIRDLADFMYFFPKDTALTAVLFDESGSYINDCVDYVAEERQLKFPAPRLTVEAKEREIKISSNHFARCVEIMGEKDGDPFGWLFSDNYFDLLPGYTKTIRVVDGPDSGIVKVKPHYSAESVTVSYGGK